ncbi:MAG: DNA cytosine methyltransferase [Alphaproteobacteria bacterium]|nr:DNA cytosine methyltransferase [Alphaproteobacteria bacterium]
MSSVELFAGAGGLGMGAALAGFKPKAVIERDGWACQTISRNQERGFQLVADWPVSRIDVREFPFEGLEGPIDLVTGGPPCQPFSTGGKHRAYLDERDMFPATVSVIRKLRPRAFIIENVRGLTRETFRNYFEYVKRQFEFPDIGIENSEEWLTHFARLERERNTGQNTHDLRYRVTARVLNAANHGAPQKRERIFIVGFREDQETGWSFADIPLTHSFDALLADQWVSGAYWNRHRIASKDRPDFPNRHARRVDALRGAERREEDGARPWITVRDALLDLPDPLGGEAPGVHNHTYQPGARSYAGHTGSPLDMPAKALKAGVHGVPGGENMMVHPDGCLRYFTVREAARLQCFPDEYVLHGAWSETMRQLGNAVPVRLAEVVAKSVADALGRATVLSEFKHQ